MAKLKSPVNPFYILVVLLGVVFTVTAFAYATMAYRAIAPGADRAGERSGLMVLLDRYGVQVLAVEIVALGIATLGAMWLDQVQAKKDLAAEARKPGSKRRRLVIVVLLWLSLLPVLVVGIWLLGELGGQIGD